MSKCFLLNEPGPIKLQQTTSHPNLVSGMGFFSLYRSSNGRYATQIKSIRKKTQPELGSETRMASQ